jgi:hypothetical protein
VSKVEHQVGLATAVANPSQYVADLDLIEQCYSKSMKPSARKE